MKSGISGWVLAIARTLDVAGIPHEKIFQQVGMDPAGLNAGSNRYSQETVSRLWRAAVQETADPYFGLKVASQIRPSTFSVVGYAMSCSATLGDALNRFARYAKLISNSATVTLTEDCGKLSISFNFDTGGAPPIFHTIDTVVAGLVCFSSWIAGKQVVPHEVHFRHERPEDIKAYTKILKCPIHFGQENDCIVFNSCDMTRPILSADEQLAALLDSMAVTQMAQLSERFSKKVRDCLVQQFAEGEISRRGTAERMHMTERTLLRRLKDENTTFQEVLDRLREELAYEYLSGSDVTVQAVSSMLGFSDASTFSRAFKRWTGRRPSLAQHKDTPPSLHRWTEESALAG
ncbi:AraC family transcriptional regulator [Pseudomonas sp. Bout1]|uniref:AraC family transcriptional regulator n=1 Tax=unclassified Pseudomonas TaxID=196821 RepID=UPI002AB5D52C|nr:AraC family transcriptional regulator [Pseudomonas sp. Bout1]MDY7533087.1 AraC family transcriptional regulator [Pseudomonas sp. Bout1]MEB0184433.1 AraC family transcriptional regulator [Pseudomonas sp. Bout1]